METMTKKTETAMNILIKFLLKFKKSFLILDMETSDLNWNSQPKTYYTKVKYLFGKEYILEEGSF